MGSRDVLAEEVFAWPDGQKMAISLSYDDALNSQLDIAIPALDKHGLAASFYLTLASPVVRQRLSEWRAAAMKGHELGNHTIYHPCSAALPDRDWVKNYHNIDDYEIGEIVDEVIVANSFLHAIDGRQERTFTVPCGDFIASGESYLPAVRELFIAIKGFEFEDKTTSGRVARQADGNEEHDGRDGQRHEAVQCYFPWSWWGLSDCVGRGTRTVTGISG